MSDHDLVKPVEDLLPHLWASLYEWARVPGADDTEHTFVYILGGVLGYFIREVARRSNVAAGMGYRDFVLGLLDFVKTYSEEDYRTMVDTFGERREPSADEVKLLSMKAPTEELQ